MGFGKIFLLNMALLITMAYLANILYKYVLVKISSKINYILSVLWFIFAGWICMKFGFQLKGDVLFDLRIVPLIIAAIVYAKPVVVMIISFGIGLSRLTFGISEAALAGTINFFILGILCAVMITWMNKRQFKQSTRGILTILVLNTVNVLNIGIFGVIPFKEYILTIMPSTLPITLLFSCIFALILLDFQMDQRRKLELLHTNELMTRQTEELRQAKLSLEERAGQLAQASQYKSEFLANMSHELRTPLNSIINLAEMISESEEEHEGEALEKDTPNYGNIIYKSGRELLQLINDILDLSKVEAGRLEVVQEEVVLAEVVQLMELQFEHDAEQKGIEFEVTMMPELPSTIQADAQRLCQILRNLLSNAFKFTHQGRVDLMIHKDSSACSTSGEWIVFSVADTGIGIPQDKHEAIFEMFRQADGSISRKYGGTGLGLPISQDLARLMGGFIQVDSREGAGSLFHLYLPLIQNETADGLSDEEKEAHGDED
ncbi:hypothetical protein J41TS12_27840 [Paenibacillus antibioticophila]|uniref:Circadian input-output histidine kinase CikA n=1 Tax=Paenibacillus antibioticophila TaxID=1274374 RepID=A0A919XWT8_9BACL|nr:ATP-binding protein [Paenibacillus antibioticophila]GIO37923.1 hypothetical protein J41TS12_27840 [Paenibacillus antibioticophila]